MHPIAATVAIDAAGRRVHQGSRHAAPAQRVQQGAGALVGVAHGGRWRQMQHPLRQASEAAQALGPVQIAPQRRGARRAQRRHTHPLRTQRTHRQLARQQGCNTQANVATTDDQQATAAKARGQGAQGGLD